MMLRGAALLAVLLLGAWSGASRAEETVPGPDRTLKGDAVCTHCHDETEAKPVLSIYKTPHGVKADERTPGCQSCHGPSVAHVKNPDGASTRPLVDINFGVRGAAAARLQAETCLSCHTGGQREHWAGSEHERRDVPCTSCHTPHGSNNPALLKARTPWLCQQCHTSDHSGPMNSGANLPGGNATTVNGLLPLANQSPRSQLNARNCLSCHSMVHGSNHPAGARFSK